ncbi:MAG: prephenate dehydrogenase/arogenate dehydrogenase family protein, partial [Clostridia bacterium]|nr:prephenate dehydrogenase/arogenate dehydrogenase family protein [Clostridia bacterium]
VGSTKGDVAALIQDLKLEDRFIGGHPLAGSEKSGYVHSKPNLFENAYYVLTPFKDTKVETLDALKTVVQDLGALPIEMSPKEHDHVTAAISHVPHVIASLLVNMVSDLDGPKCYMKTVAAGGFKDITRIASSSPELWTGICFSNKQTVLETLRYIDGSLKEFMNNLQGSNEVAVLDFFKNARTIRSTFSERKSLIQKTFDISVDVEDKPGIIAVIASALAKENINIKNIGILNHRETEEGALEIQFEDQESREQGMETLIALGYKVKAKG